MLQLPVGLEIFRVGHPHEFLQRPDFLLFRLNDRLLLVGFPLVFLVFDGAQAQLDFVVDVVGHQRHLFDDFLFVVKPVKRPLQPFIEFSEFLEQFVAPGFAGSALPHGVLVVHVLVAGADLFDELAQRAQMVVAAFNLLVQNNAVEPLLGRLGDQFLRQRDVLLAGEAEAVDDFFDLVFRVFNPLGNLDLLFARQQGHLPHLLEIHPHRIVQNVQPGFVLFLFRLRLFDAVHLGLVHDFHLEIAELDVDFIQFLRRDHRVGQRIVDVVVRQIPLLLRQPNEFLDLFGQIDPRLAFDRADRLFRRAEGSRVGLQSGRTGLAVGAQFRGNFGMGRRAG